jgi:hypothetical protein
MSEFVRLNGPPTLITPQDNNESEYRYDLKKLDPSCVHWWRVHSDGKIVGYRYQGYCRPIG